MFLVVNVGLYYPLLTVVGGHRVAVVICFCLQIITTTWSSWHYYIHPYIVSLFCFVTTLIDLFQILAKVDSNDCIATLFSSHTHNVRGCVLAPAFVAALCFVGMTFTTALLSILLIES